MEVRIYGASDDLVEVRGCSGADEFSAPEPGVWRGDLVAPDGGALRVHVMYDGCWHVAVGQVDEDFPLPDWPLRFEVQRAGARQERVGYSTALIAEVPDGTRLTNVGEVTF
jgi:hypothetical protein